MTTEIDWVEIPASSFVAGLSDVQRQAMRAQLHIEFNLESLSKKKRHVLDSLAEKYRRTAREEAYSVTEDLTLEERLFKPAFGETLFNYLLAEAELERIPPQQEIFVPTFYISRFPITHAQCDLFYASDFGHRSEFEPRSKYSAKELDSMPEQVSYERATVIAHWLRARLPSAIEWEKAARGVDGRIYPWGDNWDPANGNFEHQHRPEYSRQHSVWTTVVNAYPGGVSPYGVWDMLGNLREWTSTRIVPKKAKDEYAVSKGESAREVGLPNWFWSIPARQSYGPNYVGFRPAVSEPLPLSATKMTMGEPLSE